MSTTRTADRTDSHVEDMVEPGHGQAQLPALAGTGAQAGYAPKPPSQAEIARGRIDAFIRSVENKEADILPFLKATKVSWEFFIAGVRRAFMRDPKLIDAKPASFLMAVMDCARVGLIPDGKRAVIMAFKGNATLVIMYEGMLEVIYRAGVINAVHSQVIYKGEDAPEMLSYDLGDTPFIKFTPPLTRDDTQPIIGAFARASSKDGGKWLELMGAKELVKVSKVNKAANGPGKDWPGEMARKAPLRRLCKFLPKTPELIQLMEIDDKSYLDKPAADNPAHERAGAIPATALLGDAPYVPPEEQGERIEGLEVEGEEQEEASAGPEAPADTIAMEAMIHAAQDADELEQRAETLRTDEDWGFASLPSDARARVEFVIEERRKAFAAPVPRLQISSREGKARDYPNGDEWAAAMLAKISMPKNDAIVAWWEANVANLETAVVVAPNQARRVLAAAAVKALPQASRLVDMLEPAE